MPKTKLRDAICSLLPQDGSTIGNIKLRQLLAEKLGHEVDEALYAEARDELGKSGRAAQNRDLASR